MGVLYTEVPGYVPTNPHLVGIGNRVVAFGGAGAGEYAIYDVNTGFVGAWALTAPPGYTVGMAPMSAIEHDGKAWTAFGGYVVSVDPVTAGCAYYPIKNSTIRRRLVHAGTHLVTLSGSNGVDYAHVKDLSTGVVTDVYAGSGGGSIVGPAWYDPDGHRVWWRPNTSSSTGSPSPQLMRCIDLNTLTMVTYTGTSPAGRAAVQVTSKPGEDRITYHPEPNALVKVDMTVSPALITRPVTGPAFGNALVYGPDNRFWSYTGSSIVVVDGGMSEAHLTSPARSGINSAARAGSKVVYAAVV